MGARHRVALALAVLAVGGAGGLSLAQDQNQTENALAPPVTGPPMTAPTTAEPPTQLDIPPPEDAPPAEPPPPVAHAAPPPGNITANVMANVTAELPELPPPPPKRPRYTTVVLQALDKITAETLRFEAQVNEPVRYKDLVITVHACETEASDEPYAQTAAHLEVQYQPELLGGRTPQVARQVFRGWMFGDAPGLHAFEHPIYDVWVIACKTPSAPATPTAPAPAGASL